jgi:hypothetical protein
MPEPDAPEDFLQFCNNLQNPETPEGARNIFYGIWGEAQSQFGSRPGLREAWNAVAKYFRGLEQRARELEAQKEP